MRRFVKVLAGLFALAAVAAGGLLAWLLLAYPKSRPAPAERIEATPARLARGAYLVNHVTGCLGCHSGHLEGRYGMPVRAGTEGQGGMPFDEDLGLPGRVQAQNITPDRDTGIGDWTDGEVLRAIREGVSRDGTALFPQMPYCGLRPQSNRSC